MSRPVVMWLTLAGKNNPYCNRCGRRLPDMESSPFLAWWCPTHGLLS